MYIIVFPCSRVQQTLQYHAVPNTRECAEEAAVQKEETEIEETEMEETKRRREDVDRRKNSEAKVLIKQITRITKLIGLNTYLLRC